MRYLAEIVKMKCFRFGGRNVVGTKKKKSKSAIEAQSTRSRTIPRKNGREKKSDFCDGWPLGRRKCVDKQALMARRVARTERPGRRSAGGRPIADQRLELRSCFRRLIRVVEWWWWCGVRNLLFRWTLLCFFSTKLHAIGTHGSDESKLDILRFCWLRTRRFRYALAVVRPSPSAKSDGLEVVPFLSKRSISHDCSGWPLCSLAYKSFLYKTLNAKWKIIKGSRVHSSRSSNEYTTE